MVIISTSATEVSIHAVSPLSSFAAAAAGAGACAKAGTAARNTRAAAKSAGRR